MHEIKDKIEETCDGLGILVSEDLPVKVGPDVYMFHGTELTDQCSKHGNCRDERYYAIVGKVVCIVKDGRVL